MFSQSIYCAVPLKPKVSSWVHFSFVHFPFLCFHRFLSEQFNSSEVTDRQPPINFHYQCFSFKYQIDFHFYFNVIKIQSRIQNNDVAMYYCTRCWSYFLVILRHTWCVINSYSSAACDENEFPRQYFAKSYSFTMQLMCYSPHIVWLISSKADHLC